MREPDDFAIKDMLEKDYIGRNSQLAMMIKFINSFDTSLSPVVAIDSPWGSGKTVFVKQLWLLNEDASIASQAIDEPTLETFRSAYTTYYFNAWENDYIDDPLQALVLNILNDLDVRGLQQASIERGIKGIDVSGLIKTVTAGGIDLKKINEEDEIIKDVSIVVSRKQRINELVSKYVAVKEKRLLFIIDELDRCRPSFAVNLLEVIKHYFADENIVFLLATNNTQLVHTICKYYGNGFDGAAYLDRFFDYNVTLQRPDRAKFIQHYLGRRERGWINSVPESIAEHLDMSMREIESYHKALELVSGYIGRNSFLGDSTLAEFSQYIFTPLALGLKIKRPQEYSAFVNGRGVETLKALALESEEIQYIAQRYSKESGTDFNASMAAEVMIDLYVQLLNGKEKGRENYHAREIKSMSLEVVNLISRFSTVKEEKG